MNAGADRPVLIYQMGKVASSALCAALNDAGIAAAQTHFLGNAALTAILQRLLNPALADHFAHHLQGQLELNTRLTRHLLRARQAVEQASEGADKIKLISLTREPLNWYLAEFIQNFDGYMPALRAFCGRAADDHRDDSACILEAHHAMLATLARLRLPPNMRTHADIAGILKPALSDAHQEALLPNARNLFKPILWFQRLFAEPTGIDVFAQEPQTGARGAALRERLLRCTGDPLRGSARGTARGCSIRRLAVADIAADQSFVGQAPVRTGARYLDPARDPRIARPCALWERLLPAIRLPGAADVWAGQRRMISGRPAAASAVSICDSTAANASATSGQHPVADDMISAS